MKIRLLVLLFLSLFFINPSYSLEEKKVVRVGISNQNFSTYDHKSVKITSSDVISIIHLGANTQNAQIATAGANSIIEVSLVNYLYNIIIDGETRYIGLNGPLLFSSNKELYLPELNRKGTPAKYKGMIEIKTSAKNNQFFNIINVVDMQNYLRGVVPNEMPVSFGLEALKAQAIAARNYATNANMSPNYDLVDSTAAQVYYGANSYRDITDSAVLQTTGIYALYNEKPISALYFSTSTGVTDDWDDIFGDGTKSDMHPYLKPVFDKEKQKSLECEEDLIEFLSKNDSGYDVNSPKFRWSFEISREDLEDILHNTLQEQSKVGNVSPKYDGDYKLEGLRKIKALKRTTSGKITELLISTKTGDYKVKKELAIRRVLKINNNTALPSAIFYVKAEPEYKNGVIKIFECEEDEKLSDKFTFVGGGFGHGVGMSQFGAYSLAKLGEKFPFILKHYYTGIKLSTIPKEVYHNDYNVFYNTNFYFDKDIFKNAFLYIQNDKNVNEFPFKINDYIFGETNKISNNDFIKINITEYLKQGLNTIIFAPLSNNFKNKSITYRVEFE